MVVFSLGPVGKWRKEAAVTRAEPKLDLGEFLNLLSRGEVCDWRETWSRERSQWYRHWRGHRLRSDSAMASLESPPYIVVTTSGPELTAVFLLPRLQGNHAG